MVYQSDNTKNEAKVSRNKMKESDYIECCKSLNACLIEIEWVKQKLKEELEKEDEK